VRDVREVLMPNVWFFVGFSIGLGLGRLAYFFFRRGWRFGLYKVAKHE
jgi:hypothetical protein